MKFRRLLLLTTFALASTFADAMVQQVDTLRFTVYFPSSGTAWGSLPEEQRNAYSQFIDQLRKSGRDIREVILTTSSSLEGKTTTNIALSNARARTMKGKLLESGLINETDLTVLSQGEGWEVLRQAVLSGKETYSSDVSDIITGTPVWVKQGGKIVGGRKQSLKILCSGRVWFDMVDKYFELMRRAEIVVAVDSPSDKQIAALPERTAEQVAGQPEQDPVNEAPQAKEVDDTAQAAPIPGVESGHDVPVALEAYDASSQGKSDTGIVEVYVPAVRQEVSATEDETRAGSRLFVGTNLLYDAFTVTNANLQYAFLGHIGVNMSAMYSPWNLNGTARFNTLIFRPELRYYFANGYCGHYFGLEGHYGFFDIALPHSGTRYQSMDGNSPLYGAGLMYGYMWWLSNHFGFDFNISSGYVNLNYDSYYNTVGGAKYDTGSWSLLCPTGVGLSAFFAF